MNFKSHFLVSYLCILFVYVSCPATTYYVDPVIGYDDNPGTFEFPKQTIVNTIGVATDYDTIILMDGTYQGVNNRNISFSGKAI
ncbi:MAG: hypothetical protein KAR47_15685 [Planctomycetes bacterium]|nr:hypothetical protein [Planctomycetota bacterium]